MLAALDFEGNPLKVKYDWMGRRKTALESADTGRKEQLLSRRLLAASQEENGVLDEAAGRGREQPVLLPR
jgi:hypothetical protein